MVLRTHLCSTGGPIEHVSLRCLLGHVFLMPVADLTRAQPITDETVQVSPGTDDATSRPYPTLTRPAHTPATRWE